MNVGFELYRDIHGSVWGSLGGTDSSVPPSNPQRVERKQQTLGRVVRMAYERNTTCRWNIRVLLFQSSKLDVSCK